VFYRTRRTKNFLVRVKLKKNLIKIFQCRIVMKFILSYENEIYYNLNKIHRMKLFFDYQQNDNWNDLTNNDFLFFFRSLFEFLKFFERSSNRWKIFFFEIERLIYQNQINQSLESFVFDNRYTYTLFLYTYTLIFIHIHPCLSN
jgi:hypothetical protein